MVDTDKRIKAALIRRCVDEWKRRYKFAHGTILTQAERIEFDEGKIAVTFSPGRGVFVGVVNRMRPRLEQVAAEVIGQPTEVVARIERSAP